jgi:hypothetical protein
MNKFPLTKEENLPAALIEELKKVTAKRPKTVIDHMSFSRSTC